MLETVVALVTPCAAYVLGQALHVSPVMAVIVTGLVIGGRRERITTAQTRLQLHWVHQNAIFLLETVVFSLIGLQLPTLIRNLSHSEAWPAGGAGGGRDADGDAHFVGVSAFRPSSSGAAVSGVRRGRSPPWCPGQAPAGWIRVPRLGLSRSTLGGRPTTTAAST